MIEVLQMNHDRRALLLTALVIIVCGAIALPMLPVWQGAIRLLAGLVLIAALPPSSKQKIMFVVLAALAASGFAMWLSSLFDHPFHHVIHTLTDIYGQPFDVISDGTVLLYDVLCVFGLARIAGIKMWGRDRLVAVFALCLTLFWGWALFTVLVAVFRGVEPGKLAQMMTGVSVWATWVYWAFAAILLVQDESDIRDILKGAGIAGLMIGLVVAVQWVVGDFSYVLDAPDFGNYFHRVRGTDYYHASATFGMVLTSGVLLALVRRNRPGALWLFGSVVILISMAALNNSRAMSIALLSGLLVIGLGAIRQKNYLLMVVAFLGCVAISNSILYVKPVSGITELEINDSTVPLESARELCESYIPEIKPNEVDESSDDGVDVEDIVVANSSRSLLAVSGLQMVPSAPWVGNGVGTLDLQLKGLAFNGLQSTYSTHTLYLDILLMAGAPALLFCLALFGISAWRVMSDGLITVGNDNSYRAPQLLAVLVMFAIGCLFLPQERNELIGIAFLLSSLAVLRPGEREGAELVKSNSIQRWGIGLVILGVAGWSLLTSPAYVFPTIEFAARYGSGVAENGESVAVTEPVMKPLLEVLLRMRGVPNPNVTVLRDSREDLPNDKTWILWSPKRDHAYPGLRKALGYQGYRQGGHAPSLLMPRNWWVMPSSQPMVSIVYVGAQPNIPLPLQEVATVTTVTGAAPAAVSREEGRPIVYSVSKMNPSWAVRRDLDIAGPFLLSIEPEDVGNGRSGEITVKVSENHPVAEDITLDGENLSPGMRVALKGALETWPNRAYNADILMHPDGSGVNLADLNYGSAALWNPGSEASVVFDLKSDVWPPIGVYRMVALNWRDTSLASSYSWAVEGSHDCRSWQTLDKRESVMLSRDQMEPSAFVIPDRDEFRFYRFRFFPSLENESGYGGLMEIELYPLP